MSISSVSSNVIQDLLIASTSSKQTGSVASALSVVESSKTATLADSIPTESSFLLAAANGLQALSSDFAYSSSQLQSAQSNTQQINDIIQQLQTLAKQASDSAAAPSASLDAAFQELLSKIASLLSGGLSGSLPSKAGAATFNSTFNGQNFSSSLPALDQDQKTLLELLQQAPSILTKESANSASTLITKASDKNNDALKAIQDRLDTINYASAYVDTALNNYNAASSTLGGDTLLQSLLGDTASATKAQTSNISNSLLTLIQ